ncbi:MAG: hypothetical protein FJX76_06755 [Armatimonadetes bacterium]|nr:hypothetical protein [Armatimonadota bacterium]
MGACMLVRREVFYQTDGFDAEIFLYGEEQEWCWRIRRAGWTIAFEPAVTVVHRGGASAPESDAWRTRLALEGDLYFQRRHATSLGRRLSVLARAAGLAFEAAAFGILSLCKPSGYVRDRLDTAWLELRMWLAIVAGRGRREGSRERRLKLTSLIEMEKTH